MEKSSRSLLKETSGSTSPVAYKELILFVSLIGVIGVLNQLFAMRDLVNIFLIITFSGSIILIYTTPKLIRSPIRLTYVLLSLGSLLWMSQTIAESRSTKSDTSSMTEHFKEVKKWIQTGAFIGSPSGDFRRYEGDGCESMLVEHEKFKGRYAGGLWYEQSSHRKPSKHALFGIGANISRYEVTPVLQSNSQIGNKGSFSIGTYLGGDHANFGYKFGVFVGDLIIVVPSRNDIKKIAVLPFYQLRIGNREKVFGQFGLFDDIQQGPFATTDRSFLGINVGTPESKNQSILKIGAVNLLARGDTRFYFGGKFDLNKSFFISPDIQIGDPFSFGLGLGVNFSR